MEELRGLWAFVRVAEAGSFSAAARRLSLSVAALSKSIARLEAKLDAQLFVRTTRALRLTAEGRLLYEQANRSFGELEQTLARVRSERAELAGLVRLSTVTAYGRYALLPVLPAFLTRYPGIDLELSFHDGGRELSRQGFDVRITWGEQRERGKVARRLCAMPLVLIASPAYLARHGTPTAPQQLAAHQCILATLPTGTRALWKFKPRGTRAAVESVAPNGRVTVADELATVIDAALVGLGITVVAAHHVAQQLEDGALVRLLPDYDIQAHDASFSEIIIQYPQRRLMPPRVRVLVDFLIERLQST